MKSHIFLFAISAGAITALLSYYGTGLHPIWALLWFAPVPILSIAPRLGAGSSFGLAGLAWFIGQTNVWKHLVVGIGLPWPLIVLSFLISAVLFAIGVLLVRTFLRRGSLFLAAAALPLWWVFCEYIVANTSPHATYGNLAYTQMNCLPVIQIASVTGIWGISFVVFLFAGTVGTLLSGIGQPRRRRTLAVTVGIILCTVFLFGAARLRLTPPAQAVAVTLIAKDVPMSVYLGSEQTAIELLHEYADEIRRVTPAGTDVVVLPEKIGRVSENALPEVDALFSSVAKDAHAAITLGLVRQTGAAAFNSSRFYSAAGKLEGSYDKHHLLPGVEPESPGTERVVIQQPSGRWGLQICKDMDFPQLSRQYSREGADLLLVPAWDFDLDRWMHARMAALRGVENGFALARAARNGLLTLSDNRGRILAEKATIPGQFASISGTIGIAPEKTFYRIAGDWFAWLCTAGFAVLLISRFLLRAK